MSVIKRAYFACLKVIQLHSTSKAAEDLGSSTAVRRGAAAEENFQYFLNSLFGKRAGMKCSTAHPDSNGNSNLVKGTAITYGIYFCHP